MRILWLGTKCPWPPRDGGRLVVWNTLGALSAAGHRITFVAPFSPEDDLEAVMAHAPEVRFVPIPAVTQSHSWSFFMGLARGVPVTIARHAHDAVRSAVEKLLDMGEIFDCVHVEQLQALDSAKPAGSRGLPIVLRAQNVEAGLWKATAKGSRAMRPLLTIEAGRVARFEAAALRRVDGAVALTRADAEHLARVSGRPVDVVPAPFPAELPSAQETLDGSPPIVLIGDGSWRPNASAARFFVEGVWPELAARLPDAYLHVFGQRFSIQHERIRCIERLTESRAAFPRGALLAVPLFVASGVRMKILEAWARRVPVVASPTAVSGLEATHGRHLLVAPTAEAFVESIVSLHRDPSRRATLVAGGASLLAERHKPASVAEALGLVYERSAGKKKKSSQCSCLSGSNATREPVASSTKQS